MAFCEPLKQISMRCAVHVQRHARQRGHGVDNQQRAEFVGDLRKGSIRVTTPVEVSPWAKPTNLIFRPLPGDAHVLGSTGRPYGAVTRWIFAPVRSAMSAMRAENIPFTQTIASSPGSSTFTTAVSIPPVPDAEIGNVMPILGLEYAAHQILDAAHEFREPRVHVPHQRGGQSAVHARADAGWAWG